MQINIDKKSGIFLSIIAVLLLMLGFMASNRDGNPFGWFNHMGMHPDDKQSSSSNNLQGSDIMFAQMMIPHHEQAVQISDLALKISKNVEVLKLAAEIKAAQSPEILQMTSWLNQANAALEMGHSMGMGGMLSDSEIKTLESATGKNFDILFLNGMIAHHEGAIHMAIMVKDSANADVKALGESITKSQAAQILVMKEMLKNL
jgi:uncharacterized protein (DUF305 family)